MKKKKRIKVTYDPLMTALMESDVFIEDLPPADFDLRKGNKKA